MSQSTDDIHRKMATIRASMNGGITGIVSNAKDLVDWKYYLRSYPWTGFGLALAVGYLAVPRRSKSVSPDAESLEGLANGERRVINESPSWLTSAYSLLLPALVRMGVGLLAGQLANGYRSVADKSRPQEVQS